MTYVGMERKVEHSYIENKHCNRESPCYECDSCKSCGGFEGGLPIDCPEKRMSYEQQECVYKGAIEYVRNKWYINSDVLDEFLGSEDYLSLTDKVYQKYGHR